MISRDEFTSRLFRIGLFAALALIVFLLGKRVVSGPDCSRCGLKDSCKGVEGCPVN